MKRLIILFFMVISLSLFGLSDKITKDLNLTKDQVGKIDPIITDFKAKRDDLRTQLKAKRDDNKKLFQNEETLDRDQVQKSFEGIASLGVQMFMLKFDFDKQIFAILTPDQIQKYKTLKIDFFNERHDMRMKMNDKMKDKKDKDDSTNTQ
jgi:Spy/CpxP family protein refolding chaperone